jgi:excisionase family DNA binding protein
MTTKPRKRRRRKAKFIGPKGIAGLDPNLTVREFAQQHRCTPQHVRNQIRAGKIPAIRLGRLFLIPLSVAQRLAAAE